MVGKIAIQAAFHRSEVQRTRPTETKNDAGSKGMRTGGKNFGYCTDLVKFVKSGMMDALPFRF